MTRWPFVLLVALCASSAWAQPARVSVLVTRASVRTASEVDAGVRVELERRAGRCEAAGRAARPFDAIDLTVAIDANGHVTRVTSHVVEQRVEADGSRRTITPTERTRSARFAACLERAVRGTAFPVGPADELGLSAAWAAPGPATGVLGPLPR